MHYSELYCLSNFSFLRSASHPQELVRKAAELGYHRRIFRRGGGASVSGHK